MVNEEFPTFYQMVRTGINVEVPKLYANGAEDFFDFMKKKGWTFTERLHNDFELSTTLSVHNSVNQDFCHHEWDRDLAEYQSNNLPKLIYQKYKQIGAISQSEKVLPLCDYCVHSEECYKGNESRKPSLHHHQWSLIELPWVGKNYNKNKIAFLGINPNEDGGLDELYTLINEVKAELNAGKTKVDFGYEYPDGRKYKGTYLWHRIAAYSKVINSALQCSKNDVMTERQLMNDDNFLPQKVADEYDNIAFLNHIKCSPVGERSKPTKKMWENCGRHILLEELKILRPDWLVVLGAGDNIWALRKNVLESDVKSFDLGLECHRTKTFDTVTNIIAVPHPAAPAGGADTKYYQILFNTVQSLKSIR